VQQFYCLEIDKLGRKYYIGLGDIYTSYSIKVDCNSMWADIC
jgi:hypothetical protein